MWGKGLLAGLVLLLAGPAFGQTDESVATNLWRDSSARTDDANNAQGRECASLRAGRRCFFLFGDESNVVAEGDGNSSVMYVEAGGGANICLNPDIGDESTSIVGTTVDIWTFMDGTDPGDGGANTENSLSLLTQLDGTNCVIAAPSTYIWLVYLVTDTTNDRPLVVAHGLSVGDNN